MWNKRMYTEKDFYKYLAKRMGLENMSDNFLNHNYMEFLLADGLINKDDYANFRNGVNFYYDEEDLKLDDNKFYEKNYSDKLKKVFERVVKTKFYAEKDFVKYFKG